MSQKIINVGVVANDGTGDTLRTGAVKINDNFTELYSLTSTYVTNSNLTTSLASYVTNSTLATSLFPYATTTSLNSLIPNQSSNSGKFLTTNGAVLSWATITGSGTVTSASVVSANGFAGTVATGSTTPAITISTSISGVLKGNGTAISSATSGTDYAPGTSALATGIIKSTTSTGALSIAVAGTDYQTPIGTISGIVKGNGANALIAAVAGTDYQAPLPSQTGNSAKFLTTDGSSLSWATVSSVSSRTTRSSTTASLANNAAGNITINGFKSYMLLSIQTSAAAWVTVYATSAARSADAGRTITTDPTPGSGVLAEIITTGSQTQLFSPAVLGFSDETSPSTDIQVKVVNRSGSTTTITVTIKLVQLEV